ncbi:MAG: M23 family metallopeptidase [bacterium]
MTSCLAGGNDPFDGRDEMGGSPVVASDSMAGYGLILPFPVSERHVVAQGQYGSVSHTAAGGTPLAVDFSGRNGSPVLAPMDGWVSLESSGDSACPSADGMPARGANHGFGNHLYISSFGSCRVHLAHLSSLNVSDGQYVRQGETVGLEGSTGCTTGTNLHVDCSCRGSSGAWEPVRCSPLSGYTSFAEGQSFGGSEYPTLPVGTTVQAYGRSEIYLVCDEGTLCHIADWEAYRSRRFFYDSSYPTAEVVRTDESALDCYRRGPDISGTSDRYLIDCLEGDFMVFREGGRAIRRWIPFNFDGTRMESELLLKSWGMAYPEDLRAGALSSDCRLPEGEALTLRNGTVIELPDDSDFYVVTGDRYENEADQTARHGYVMRLRRASAGRPFMPLLYGSYNRVLQVPSDAVFTMTSGMIHGLNEYTTDLARRCEYGHGSGGPGVESCGDGSCGAAESCSSCPTDCGSCPSSSRCGDGNCNVGESCRSCPGDCTDCPSSDGCVRDARRCDSPERYAVCTYDSSSGTNVWQSWPCGYGAECSDGNCWSVDEPGPEPDSGSDPPHTIRCDLDSSGLAISITGPILDALIESPVSPTSLQYGSDTDGWIVPYGSGSGKQSLSWTGDDSVYVFDLPRNVDRINFYVVDSRSASRASWFDFDPLMDDGYIPWTGRGDCRVEDRLLIVGEGFGLTDDTEPDPEPAPDSEPFCGDRTCDSGETCSSCARDCGTCPPRCGDGSCNGTETCSSCARDCGACPDPEPDPDPDPSTGRPTIDCDLRSGSLTVTVSGIDPMTDLTDPIAFPGCVTYGSDTESWAVPPEPGSRRECLSWRGSGGSYVFAMPRSASRFNFFMTDSRRSGGGAWFDLALDWGPPGMPWEVTGDCHWIPGLIVQN